MQTMVPRRTVRSLAVSRRLLLVGCRLDLVGRIGPTEVAVLVQGKSLRRERALAHKGGRARRSVGQHEHDWLKDAEHVAASGAERAGMRWEAPHAMRIDATTALHIGGAYRDTAVVTRSRWYRRLPGAAQPAPGNLPAPSVAQTSSPAVEERRD